MHARTQGSWTGKILQHCVDWQACFLAAVQVIAEEFAYVSNRSRGFRCALFAASLAGFTLVALLQLIHDGD